MSPAALPQAASNALRVVLFGARSAGKSRLLEAMQQTAPLTSDLLGGKLHLHTVEPPPGQELADIREGRFDPADARALIGPMDLVLLDCDSQHTERLVQDEQALQQEKLTGLADTIHQADAILLTLDASAGEEEMQTRFEEFGKFLKSLQQRRGQQAEVTDLPVFLVLTKCDLLFRAGDELSDWMERIDERKREVGQKFRTYLQTQPPSEGETASPTDDTGRQAPPSAVSPAFGRIKLHVSATALQQPILRSLGGKMADPFSPTLLFRECLREANAYRQRRLTAQRRLVGLVVALSVLLLALVSSGLFALASFADSQLARLEDRVNDLRYFERGGPAVRLRGLPEELREKQRRLETIANDSQFHRLSPANRQFVEELLDEIKEYVPYLEKLLSEPALDRVPTEEALRQHQARLEKELALPRPDWQETPAAQIRQGRVESLVAIRQAIEQVRNWYIDRAAQANRLWTMGDYVSPVEVGIDWAGWAASVESQVDNQQPPFAESEQVPGVKGVPVYYASIYRFDRVVDARLTWRSEREKLARLLDVCTALGLAPATQARPAVLLLPGDFTLAGATVRLMELRTAYPDYPRAFNRQTLPDAVRSAVRLKARQQYRLLLSSGRAEVLRQLQLAGRGSEETLERWKAVRAWLDNPRELSAWRELARTLLELDDPRLPDPVTALAEFLGVRQFSVDPRQIQVEIPELRGLRPRAEARLLIYWRSGDREQTLQYVSAGPPQRDGVRRTILYPFKLVNERGLIYRPGDRLWAELSLSGDSGRLVWSQSRSAMYQFERLRNGARQQLQPSAEETTGRPLDDVLLRLEPDSSVPNVPDLLPVVRLSQ